MGIPYPKNFTPSQTRNDLIYAELDYYPAQEQTIFESNFKSLTGKFF